MSERSAEAWQRERDRAEAAEARVAELEASRENENAVATTLREQKDSAEADAAALREICREAFALLNSPEWADKQARVKARNKLRAAPSPTERKDGE